MASTTPMVTRRTSRVVRMLRTCITQQSVRLFYARNLSERCSADLQQTAKKEDNPEEALKEFRAIVDQEEDKGDWYVHRSLAPSLFYLAPQGI
jgi:hypothetical protein